MDTLVLIAAYCLLTPADVQGWVAVSPDSLIISTNLYSERSAARWNENHATTAGGLHISFKPLGGIELYHKQRGILVLGRYEVKRKQP